MVTNNNIISMNTRKPVEISSADEFRIKLKNLESALNEVGIETSLWFDEESGYAGISANLWNCYDGSNVEFTVAANESTGFEEIEHYADPDTDRERFQAKIEEWCAEIKA